MKKKETASAYKIALDTYNDFRRGVKGEINGWAGTIFIDNLRKSLYRIVLSLGEDSLSYTWLDVGGGYGTFGVAINGLCKKTIALEVMDYT